jgi:uncharacterized protein (TIGR00730 family)
MAKKRHAVKAYKNEKFLSSPAARTVRILSEFYEPEDRFKRNNVVDTIVFFGSARFVSEKEAKRNLNKVKREFANKRNYKQKLREAETLLKTSRYYEDAVELSRRLTEWSLKLSAKENRFIICSGGGPGIMEAASKGAKLAGGKSIGLNISIPFEQYVNQYVTPELSFEFHYFFMRKFWFAYLAKALVVFPGGFGTMDELMEILTLVQTGKIKKEMKIIIYDKAYWDEIFNFEGFLKYGTVSKKDFKLFDFVDSIDDAFNIITEHFTKYYLHNGNHYGRE